VLKTTEPLLLPHLFISKGQILRAKNLSVKALDEHIQLVLESKIMFVTQILSLQHCVVLPLGYVLGLAPKTSVGTQNE
jgi:hypothetical protein